MHAQEYNEQADCVGEGLFRSCNPGQWLVPVYMLVYLLSVNILLVNLLIAMFSRRFEKIQSAARILWRLQYYRMLVEYRERPVVPAPASVAVMLWDWLRAFCHRKDEEDANTPGQRILDFTQAELEQFQERQTERCDLLNYLELRRLTSLLCRWYEQQGFHRSISIDAEHDPTEPTHDTSSTTSEAQILQMLHAESIRSGEHAVS